KKNALGQITIVYQMRSDCHRLLTAAREKLSRPGVSTMTRQRMENARDQHHVRFSWFGKLTSA
ncbi:MAG: hypothetical protein ABGX05_19525, partial [Pirellulaceae bacterium]